MDLDFENCLGAFTIFEDCYNLARVYSLLRLFEIKLPALEQGTDIPEAVWVAIQIYARGDKNYSRVEARSLLIAWQTAFPKLLELRCYGGG